MNRKEILADIAIVEGDISRAGGRSSVQVPTSPEACAAVGREWEFQHEKVLVLKAELAELNELLRLLDQLKEGLDD